MVSFFTAILGAARKFFGTSYFVTALVEDWLRIVLEGLHT